MEKVRVHDPNEPTCIATTLVPPPQISRERPCKITSATARPRPLRKRRPAQKPPRRECTCYSGDNPWRDLVVVGTKMTLQARPRPVKKVRPRSTSFLLVSSSMIPEWPTAWMVMLCCSDVVDRFLTFINSNDLSTCFCFQHETVVTPKLVCRKSYFRMF